MRHGSLFNGIGGFQLAAHWMGWENVMSCEIDEFCNKVTNYHFPNCIQHGDIKTADFSIYRGRIDVLTGGFPCQPFSLSGKRMGTADNRYLWPEMLRAIGEIQPRWIVGENVRGIVNWSKGMVFEQVQADLENEGYEQIPLILPACGVNAPHRRDRTWFVAHARSEYIALPIQQRRQDATQNVDANREDESRPTANTPKVRRRPQTEGGLDLEGNLLAKTEREESANSIRSRFGRDGWQQFPTQSPVCYRNDGISERLDISTISKKSWKKKSRDAAGNAIVPQVAYEIFKAIEEYERTIK